MINYYYFNRVGVYCSEERQGIVITGLFVYLMRDLHIIFVRCALFGLRRFCPKWFLSWSFHAVFVPETISARLWYPYGGFYVPLVGYYFG